MAFENVRNTVPALEAGEVLTTAQFKAVKMSTVANRVLLATSLGERVIGILQNKPSAIGQAATVAVPGSTTKMVAGATVNPGAFVTTTATGLAITAVATNNVLGICLEGGAVNQLITVQLADLGNAP